MNISWMLYSFRGRLGRAWYWPLSIGITAVFGVIVELYEGVIFESNGALVLALIALLFFAYVMGALAAKRLHDRNRSALLLLIMFVPIIGWIYPLWFLVDAALPGTRGDNRFGPDPRPLAASPGGAVACDGPDFIHRVEWISWGDVRNGLGEAIGNVVGLVVIAGLIGGYAVTENWAAYRGVTLGGIRQHVSALRQAIADDGYWDGWSERFFHTRGAQAGTPATSGTGNATPVAPSDSSSAPAEAPTPIPRTGNEEPAWRVGYETDPDSPISDRKVLIAQMTHPNTAAAGHIEVQATCANGAIDLEFDSFGPADKSADFDYSMGESDGNIFVVYRLDSGPQLLATNLLSGNHNYVNVVNVAFAHVGSDYKPVLLEAIQAQAEAAAKDSDTFGKTLLNAMTLSMSGLGALYGAMTPRDIEPFLRASLVRFQLPLKGGAKEVIGFSPRVPEFRDFLSRCGIAPVTP
jgi:uncharacterized membrane protein YhaH (DUF805 family)